jgi:5-formyltetrahydrofolate cyclo-ligase
MALVAGKKRVPSPAAGMTACLITGCLPIVVTPYAPAMGSKEEARGYFRQLRQKSQVSDRKAPSLTLINAPELASARIIASFQSYGEEPDTFALHTLLKSGGKEILLPRMNPDKSLTWLSDGIEIDPATLQKVDVVIVPALAIDSHGVRLGQGGGSFDRALPQLSGWKVALIDSVCFTDIQLPEEAHDIRVDAVATELGITRFT